MMMTSADGGRYWVEEGKGEEFRCDGKVTL